MGANDFYPFVRAELKEHDPDAYRALLIPWGIDAGNPNEWTNLATRPKFRGVKQELAAYLPALEDEVPNAPFDPNARSGKQKQRKAKKRSYRGGTATGIRIPVPGVARGPDSGICGAALVWARRRAPPGFCLQWTPCGRQFNGHQIQAPATG